MDRIRLGMVGGGRGAFIGAVHRIAARLDNQYDLVAGALSSEPERSRQSAEDIGLARDRTYSSYEHMAVAEADRLDGIQAVAIVTPNDTHAAIAIAFLRRGIHVICDKPLVVTAQQGCELRKAAEVSAAIVAVTYNYRGYPMVRQARSMCAAGLLGELRLVEVEYLQDWLTANVESNGSKQALWRTDPTRTGGAGAIGDIGVHAYDLVRYITGLRITSVCGELTSFVTGRRVDDDARVLLRFDRRARGLLWASQVAPGNDNGLSIRIYGDRGGLEWRQCQPSELLHAPLGEPKRQISAGGAGAEGAAAAITRLPPGHPEGYFEAFASIYTEIALMIRSSRKGSTPTVPEAFPGLESGLEAAEFVEAVIRSSHAGSNWQDIATCRV
jgi:predicted dehydrogenase